MRQSNARGDLAGSAAGSLSSNAITRQITAGMIDHRKTSRSGVPAASKANASRGPTTAPALSMALCRPKAKPRCPASTLATRSASRGDDLRPLPTRSANRMANTIPQLPAKAISGRPKPARA